MSDTSPTPDDLARDLRADLERATDNYGPNWGGTPRQATEAFADFAYQALPAAIRRAIAAEADNARLRHALEMAQAFGSQGDTHEGLSVSEIIRAALAGEGGAA